MAEDPAAGLPSTCDFPRRLNAARRGSRPDQEALFQHYYARIERMSHAQLRQSRGPNGVNFASRFSTADIVQEVFQSLLRNLESFGGTTEGEFVTYVAKVIRCRILDAVRYHGAACRDIRRSRGSSDWEELGELNVGPADAPAAANRIDLKSRFESALGALPEATQHLLRARIERCLGYEALAQELGYSSRYAARRAFFAAQARLVLRLKPE